MSDYKIEEPKKFPGWMNADEKKIAALEEELAAESALWSREYDRAERWKEDCEDAIDEIRKVLPDREMPVSAKYAAQILAAEYAEALVAIAELHAQDESDCDCD